LNTGGIRVRTMWRTVKHGKEVHWFRGTFSIPTISRHHRYLCRESDGSRFPLPLGNVAAGVVTETAPGLMEVASGDRMAANVRLRKTQRWTTMSQGAYRGLRRVPANMSWQAAVRLDLAKVACAMGMCGRVTGWPCSGRGPSG
jgi:NADPH:quinone reductase-like Zn-dependent oxidoreductase